MGKFKICLYCVLIFVVVPSKQLYLDYLVLLFRVVTAELTFYLETLRSLKVLPAEELGDQTLEEVWR